MGTLLKKHCFEFLTRIEFFNVTGYLIERSVVITNDGQKYQPALCFYLPGASVGYSNLENIEVTFLDQRSKGEAIFASKVGTPYNDKMVMLGFDWKSIGRHPQ